MCANYQLKTNRQKLIEAFGIDRELNLPSGDIINANYFPGSTVPVLRPADGGRELAEANWGIQLGKHRVTNSRDDKSATRWKRFMGRRVVFPLSRAVEWRYPLDMFGQPSGKPSRWWLYPADESLAAVAGIADDSGVSMMTCRAEGIAAEVHNKKPDDPRMVVFLTEPTDVAAWLDPGRELADVAELLRPPPAGWLAGEPMG